MPKMKMIKTEDLLSIPERVEDPYIPWDHLHEVSSFEDKVHKYVVISLNGKPKERDKALKDLDLLISYTQNNNDGIDLNIWCWGHDFHKQMQDLILIEKCIKSRKPHPSLYKKKDQYEEMYEDDDYCDPF